VTTGVHLRVLMCRRRRQPSTARIRAGWPFLLDVVDAGDYLDRQSAFTVI
jgi:hypothetical protein